MRTSTIWNIELEYYKFFSSDVHNWTQAAGTRRHVQGGGALALPWKCCKVFCVVNVI